MKIVNDLVLKFEKSEGNPSDITLFKPTIDRVIDNYGITPRDSSADGGYAYQGSLDHCKSKGIVNIVFNKMLFINRNQLFVEFGYLNIKYIFFYRGPLLVGYAWFLVFRC